MQTSSFWLKMDDHIDIHLRKWIVDGKQPRAILQLSHGMAEHIERYDDFAKFLIEKNIFVFGNDHRGHGKTGEKAKIHGFFAEENGFERVVDDLYSVNKHIHDEYPNTPIFLMGHSMGSFLARRYIQKYSHTINGLIISGTGGNPGIAGKLGKRVAKWEIRRNGGKAPSTTLNRLAFGAFNKHIPSPKTEFDWLTSDPSEVDKYMNDPFCGFICSSGYFYDLFTGLEIIHQNQNIQQIPKDLPIFMFSGDKDPVGGNLKGVRQVLEQYRQNGLENIEYKFYKEGRHEMLNEINKAEVYDAIYTWLNKQIEIESGQ
ncbi:alpha/beta hydrolase [Heyndrickxia sporothermodurans]|nr:alpha/beta hydrolase [Heyndrickxia sporothermodurans]